MTNPLPTVVKFILSFIGFIFLLFTCGLAVLVWKVRKHVRRMRDAMQNNMDDETFRRMSDKYYWRKKEEAGPTFDEEYFKGNPNGWRQKKKADSHSSRTTRTKEGVTIIDNRDPSKKIFTQDEGKYVDYREE